MRVTLVLHIVAGVLALVAGYVALFAEKGARLHRSSGTVFVYVMLAMTTSGFVMAVGRGASPSINVPAALLTAYLVVTGLATVRPPATGERWLNLGALMVALGVGVVCLTFGFDALSSANGAREGTPAFPFLMFGVVSLVASALDVRMIRAGGLHPSARLTRHLWRMCYALFIAALSFFLGQADEFPAALRQPALLAVPVLVPFLSMLYWLWRVRIRALRRLRGRFWPAGRATRSARRVAHLRCAHPPGR